MDISRASNFERFVFDLAGRDPARVRALWAQLERDGSFDITGSPEAQALPGYRFGSGSSTHADRLATIRAVHERHGVLVDPHTADGLHVAPDWRESGVPMICLETAQPAKFAETIQEAIGIDPPRPAGYEDIESLPQHVRRMPVDVGQLKDFIHATCTSAAVAGAASARS